MHIRHRAMALLLAATALLIGVAAKAQTPSTVEGIAVALDDKNLTLRQLNGEERKVGKPKGWEAVRPGALAKVETTTADGKPASPKITVIGGMVYATIDDIAADSSRIILKARVPKDKPPAVWTEQAIEGLKSTDGTGFTLSLSAGNDLGPTLKPMRVGDVVRVVFQREGDTESGALKSIAWRADPVASICGWFWLLSAAVLLLFIAFIFTRAHPTYLFLGLDNRYSTSKFQTVAWFWVLISAYLAIVAQRIITADWNFLGGVEIPQNLLVLSGISVLTFAASKAITTGKVEAVKAATGEDPKPPATVPKASDLISDDVNRTDLGDFQMLVITAIAVAMYAASTAEFLTHVEFRKVVTMPDIDPALLALFGLGQAAFLGKKAAGGAGAGMTPEQAKNRTDGIAQAIKTTADNAETAEQSTTVRAADAAAALVQVKGQATRVAAQPEADKARDAAQAASQAAADTNSAAKAAEVQVAEAVKLAAKWSHESTVCQPIRLSLDAARKELVRAKTAARDAASTAAKADESAKEANAYLNTLPP